MTCPRCGGRVVVVGLRAWCVKFYTDGGCGGSYVVREGKLVAVGGA